MKTQTSELTGAALDWAVAKCEEASTHYQDYRVVDGRLQVMFCDVWLDAYYEPSTDWAQGGPIIEREGLSVSLTVLPYSFNTENPWVSHSAEGNRTEVGPTPLITAMRCYVASKLGAEVDLPNELINEREIK